MIRKYVYLGLLASSIISISAIAQSSIHRPAPATALAEEYGNAKIRFCVTGEIGKRLSIEILDGEMPKGALGLVIAEGFGLRQGDCSSGLFQLSPSYPLERYAFHAKLKFLQTEVKHGDVFIWINNMRRYIGSFEGDSKNLVAGLALGIDSGLTEKFRENMKSTGLTHLTAVSGANCAIVLALFWLILRKFRLGRGTRTTVALGALAGYVFLVGWQPSVLRSAFMMGLIFISLEMGRRIWLPAALLTGSSVLLVVDPWLIFEYGFWLSILATFGLVTLTAKLAKKLEAHLPTWLSFGLAATLCAQLWCLPLLVQLQGGITTHSVLANLLSEPVVPFVTVIGLLAAVIGSVFPLLGNLLMSFGALASGWIVFVANSLALAPNGLVPIAGGVVSFVLCSVFVVAVSKVISDGRFRFSVAAAAIFSLLIFSVASSQLRQVATASANWQVLACNVGQGDALVLRSGGQYALVDVGSDSRLIDECLDGFGIQQLDLLVLTHFDFDHVGGLDGVLKGRKILRTLVSPFPDDRPEAGQLLQRLQSQGVPFELAKENQKGVVNVLTWEIFSAPGALGASANEASLGLRFESPDLVVFTLADMNENAQQRVSSRIRSSSKPTVVKVSHHGSADQFEDLYQRISADVALISVGAANSYGHPTKRILDILERTHSQVFRTDQNGQVSLVVIDGVIEVHASGAR